MSDTTQEPLAANMPRLAGVTAGTPLAEALTKRAKVLGLSDAAERSVLTPREPGSLSHALRAALAQRMARLNADETLAAHYGAALASAEGGSALAWIGDPGEPVARAGESHLAALIQHTDLLTRSPKAASRRDIEALTAAGVAEADIVRLSELAAFVNYQARVIAGLRLLATAEEEQQS